MPSNYKPRNPRCIITVIGPSIAYIPLTQGKFSLIESDDVPLLGTSNWHTHKTKSGKFYAFSWVRETNRSIGLHGFLLNTPEGMWPDHKNGDGLDNRRNGNLRLVRPEQNAMNLGLYKSNSLKVKGVHKVKDANRYRATVYANKVRYDLGLFKTIEEASAAYQAAALIHFGEFARR